MSDLNWLLGYCHAIADIWRVKQQMGSLSVSINLSNKYINNFQNSVKASTVAHTVKSPFEILRSHIRLPVRSLLALFQPLAQPPTQVVFFIELFYLCKVNKLHVFHNLGAQSSLHSSNICFFLDFFFYFYEIYFKIEVAVYTKVTELVTIYRNVCYNIYIMKHFKYITY